MADLRPKDLTDSQATYSPDIVVVVDDPTFTNNKKMAIDVIYPKTNTLSAVGNYNPAATLLRTDNGSGSENKVTVTNLLSDADVVTLLKSLLSLSSSVLSFSTAGADASFGSISFNGRKILNIYSITCTFSVSASSTTPKLLGTISGYNSPGYQFNFSGIDENTTNNESSWGYVDTDGKVYYEAGKAPTSQRLGITIVT